MNDFEIGGTNCNPIALDKTSARAPLGWYMSRAPRAGCYRKSSAGKSAITFSGMFVAQQYALSQNLHVRPILAHRPMLKFSVHR
jgi:hypothetical protein